MREGVCGREREGVSERERERERERGRERGVGKEREGGRESARTSGDVMEEEGGLLKANAMKEVDSERECAKPAQEGTTRVISCRFLLLEISLGVGLFYSKSPLSLFSCRSLSIDCQ